MKIIPAIDLRGGRCVRLLQGHFEQETVYSDDPVGVANAWERQGAQMLHVVDLDGAKSGAPVHTATIREICRAVSIPVQAGGGLRSLESIRGALEAGAWRVVLGTAALEDPSLLGASLERWPERVAVSLDAREGLLTTRGWLGGTGQLATSVASALVELGVRCIIYTDISRDGTLAGPNLASIRAIQQAADESVEVIASGGVGGLADLVHLRELGVAGVIVGKALYTGDVSLRDALAVAEGEEFVR